jgi:hypothetical protein
MGTDSKMEPPGGPFKNMFETCCSGMDMTAQRFEPWFKAMAGSNLEMLSLMSQRAQAYIEFPTNVANCRTPQDLFDEQIRFWQTAFRQYAESSQRAMHAWTKSVSSLGGFLTPWAVSDKPERDFITFPEPQEAVSAAEPEKKPGERQAA